MSWERGEMDDKAQFHSPKEVRFKPVTAHNWQKWKKK